MKKLGWKETAKLLKRFKIPFLDQYLAETPEQAVKFARKIGYPVALKIESRNIIHKTEAGGVLLNIKTEKEVMSGFEKLKRNAKKYDPLAKIDGVLVQEMFSGKNAREIITGSKKDILFGPIIMFGLGGIWVEVLRDVSFRLIPISKKDAEEMVKEIRAYRILEGIRGMKPVNFNALYGFLVKVSKLVWKNPNIQELDINPVFVDDKRAAAGDVRILV
ncbi:MAG: acetyl-CoA synthetase [Candidatus Aenigmatarchaeota archaeon]|nr:MAG: acetyl-CoA synthetase [Candidatus Aenigmarchaeota archaeon]